MKIDPDYGEVYFNYGNLLSDEGEFGAAAARYRAHETNKKKLCNHSLNFFNTVLRRQSSIRRCMPRH